MILEATNLSCLTQMADSHSEISLMGWKQGTKPRYSKGERLFAFWFQITGRSKLPFYRRARRLAGTSLPGMYRKL